MAHSSIFAQAIEFNGTTWRHIYDPEDPMMVKPDLGASSVVSFTCDPVVVPGGSEKNPLYLVIVEILIPAQPQQSGGTAVQVDRRLLGVRVYQNKPLNLSMVKPAEMHYYVAEPKFSSNENKAQVLFNTLLGLPTMQDGVDGASDDIDRTWGSTLLGDVVNGGHSDAESV